MRKFRWPPWTAGTTFVAVLCGFAAMFGGCEALGHWEYRPAPPPDGCALVRPDLVDVVVPGHERVTRIGKSSGYASMSDCRLDSATTTLAITIWHYGHGPDGNPIAQAHASLPNIFPSVPSDLGDESFTAMIVDQADFKRLLDYSRIGAYVVVVYYETRAPATMAAFEAAGHTVLQEVLAFL